ncbi:membrane protein [Enterococcus saigonensis]|uniref:Membrane protein n=1 Tax=Enterococcus saigonensis TaxID=1805431 RepID=A0A679ID04_9ENTE|nr:TIGR00341 family protein [Enterococcus saigonensis]BCA86123.1 membrane protein [Enterococcus saigonensis]
MAKNGVLNNEELYEKVSTSINIKKENFVILICAIFIASIGLNMNSQPILIGAMLISPLMAPVQGLGLGLGVFDSQLTIRALRLLILEALFAIMTALLYFWLSPLTYASSEILSRTQPTIWDAIIAILGGTAGMIGARQKEANNIVPGVAIATALMPPLCVMGYSIYTQDWSMFFGAGYLFLVNVAFIIIATFIVVRVLHLDFRMQVDTKMERRRHYLMIGAAVLIATPSFISAGNLIQTEMSQQRANRFVTEAMADYYVLNQNIDGHRQQLTLDLLGNKPVGVELEDLVNKLGDYHLENFQLIINQVANNEIIEMQDIDRYIDKKLQSQYTAAPFTMPTEKVSLDKTLSEIKRQLFLVYGSQIKKISTDILSKNKKKTGQVIVTLTQDVTKKQQEQIKVSLDEFITHTDYVIQGTIKKSQ